MGRMILGLLIGCCAWTGIQAVEVTPSPSLAPGLRLFPSHLLSHWPAIAFHGEERSVAFSLSFLDERFPASTAITPAYGGERFRIGWAGFAPTYDTLPLQTTGIGGLIPLPTTLGEHVFLAAARGGWRQQDQLRMVSATGPWPLTGLRHGFPIDASGAAVVLRVTNISRDVPRFFPLLPGNRQPGPGPAVIIGELDNVPPRALAARVLPVQENVYPHHGALAALAPLMEPALFPRMVIWLPGNRALRSGTWSEESRLCQALRARGDALGFGSRLILAMPAQLHEPGFPEQAERRRILRAVATNQGWEILEMGPLNPPTEIAPGVFLRPELSQQAWDALSAAVASPDVQ